MRRSSALFLLAVPLLGCGGEEDIKPVGSRTSSAETLGIATTDLPEGSREQALLALEQDAFHREHRFLDAANPGHLFRSTRVDQAEIDQGLWSNDELYQLGAQLFQLTFTPEAGFGGKDLPVIARFHKGHRGGPDARRCVACHWRGGPAGAGDGADNVYLDGDGDSQASALARNPPPLAGVGWLEIVAREMTEELQGYRDQAISFTKDKGYSVQVALTAKGVDFGSITVDPDGSVDTSGVKGVDADLVVKPFGWKGSQFTIRDAAEDALLIHHGMESDHLVATAGPERVGPYGGLDPDGDGVTSEISEGQVTALTLFLAMAETPQEIPPAQPDFIPLLAEGIAKFKSIGCATCHVPSLPVKSTRFVLPGRESGTVLEVDLAREAAMPRLVPAAQTGVFEVRLYSDLKRHDMGPRLAEARPDRGVPGHLFVTRPLWGVARSRPYLHDAHAPTLEDAILLHGGEAQASRDAYAALDDAGRAPIRVFLTSLTRAPRFTVP
jgi:Di-haem oxidoreductase, putative peroxidase